MKYKIILTLLVMSLFTQSCMYTVTRLPNGCKYYHYKNHSQRYRHTSLGW